MWKARTAAYEHFGLNAGRAFTSKTADPSDPLVAQVAASGVPFSREVPQGKDGGNALTTFVPLQSTAGKPAVVEVTTDLTSIKTVVAREFLVTSLELLLLMVCSFGVPAVAFFWRTRQKQRGEERIEFLAHHDTPTGLLNRLTFAAALAQRVEAVARQGGMAAVHFIDLDRFKGINDSLGHSVGDELIKAVAERLESLAGPMDLLARLGGDEFVIAQADVASPSQAEAFANTIHARLIRPYKLGQHDISIGASIGVAVAPRDGGDADGLIKAADTAMYRAKADGRDTVRVYSPEMDLELQERRDIEVALRNALETDTFILNFQPIFEAPNSRLLGFEVLLRLLDPVRGPIPPTTFIPIAEEMGLITRIGERVLQQACQIAADWPEDLIVAVNLSPKQFEGGAIEKVVVDALRQSGLPPRRLELEITEGLLLHDTESVIAQLGALRALGVSIAMDDFGTGYSSLSYLWRFPFDKLKIDRSFMSVLAQKDESVINILRTIVSLGRTLKLQVTAEGIETQEQADALVELNCNQMQGYHFGRPMPESGVADTIALHRMRGRSEAA